MWDCSLWNVVPFSLLQMTKVISLVVEHLNGHKCWNFLNETQSMKPKKGVFYVWDLAWVLDKWCFTSCTKLKKISSKFWDELPLSKYSGSGCAMQDCSRHNKVILQETLQYVLNTEVSETAPSSAATLRRTSRDNQWGTLLLVCTVIFVKLCEFYIKTS